MPLKVSIFHEGERILKFILQKMSHFDVFFL